MDSREIDELLKNSSVFSHLDEISRKNLIEKFTPIHLTVNEILFHQGDFSESVYVLAKGKLAVMLANVGQTRTAGYIHVGETLGALGVLTNEPRTLTIKALLDSTVLKLSAANFLEIFHYSQAMMNAIMHPILSRSSDLINILTSDKQNRNIVFFPATKETSLKEFTIALRAVAKKFPSTAIISDDDTDFLDKKMSSEMVNEKLKALSQHQTSTHRTCYLLNSFDTPLANISTKRASMIYVVAYANDKPKIDSHILDKIKSRDRHLVSDPQLVLIHPSETQIPLHAKEWFELSNFGLYHQVRIDKTKDFQRLLRFIRGKAVGLVLSGGGTRGWAHIGAIKAIREANIPIDIIGGTSVGGLVAGMYAMSQSYEETYEKFRQIVIDSENSISWRGLTWPILSLFDAKKYTQAQRNIFKKTRIEDLWIPYYCISSNLATNLQTIHQTGLLWEVVRASTSIPGIMPPMLLNGELHLDGGLLNNLPTDIMRQFLGKRGKIIAVQLNDSLPDKNKYDFPPVLTFKEVLLNKLRIKKYHYKFPPFLETFLHGLFLNSHLKDSSNATLANIFVSLHLTRFKMLYSNPEEGKRLTEIGYEETMKQIKKTKIKSILPG